MPRLQLQNMASKDYYKILEVSKNASLDDIRKAYKKLAKKYHPDVCKEPGAEERFKDIVEAYSVLSDPDKRSRYDLTGATDGTSGFNYADFYSRSPFADMFSNMWTGAGRTPPKQKEYGADLRITVSLTLDEIYTGVHKKLKIKKKSACHICHGSGSANNETAECQHCHGTGRIVNTIQRGNSIMQSIEECPHCKGTGEIITDPCPNCHGTGLEDSVKEIEFDIPGGMPDGSYIKIAGQGNDGPHRGIPGNLIVQIKELPNLKDIYRDDESLDLMHTEWLKPTDFIFGKEVNVPWITGTEKVYIEPGTESGHIEILQGKGMPNPNNPNERGNYVVTFDCRFPKISDFDEDERILLESLKDTEKI